MSDLILVITGSLGTLGFGLVMNLKKSRLGYVVFGGFLTTLIYAICRHIWIDDFWINLIPTIIAAIYSEILARVVKAPVTIFTIPSLVPLVPGGALYNTMRCVLAADQEMTTYYGLQTIKIALSIAVGIVAVSSVTNQIFKAVRHENVNKIK